jgi:hypothetical protein
MTLDLWETPTGEQMWLASRAKQEQLRLLGALICRSVAPPERQRRVAGRTERVWSGWSTTSSSDSGGTHSVPKVGAQSGVVIRELRALYTETALALMRHCPRCAPSN